MSTSLMDVGLDYDLWLGRVERIVERRWDIALCPGTNYRPWFDAGCKPTVAAHQILADAIDETYGPEGVYVTI